MSNFLTPWARRTRSNNNSNWTGTHSLAGNFDRAFQDIFNDGFFVQPSRSTNVGPQSYIATDDTEHRISIAIPGIPKDAVDVKIGGGTLTVGYEATSEDYNSAVFSSSFTKSWTLPEDIDAERISAESSDGVLTVVVPRSQSKASTGRTIAVM